MVTKVMSRRNIVRLCKGFRVTIPKHVRTKLGFKPGQPLYIRESEGSIVLTPVPEDPIAYLCGRFKGEPSMSQELLEDRAREVERDEAMFARFFPEAKRRELEQPNQGLLKTSERES